MGADGQRALAGGLQTVRPIALGQTQDADAGAEALLGVAAGTQDDLDQSRRGRAGGLGVAGVGPTFSALIRGQVSDLLISEEFELKHGAPVPRNSAEIPPELALELPEEQETVDLADELVTRAKATGANVSFIENPTYLAEVDGVAGILRFTL